MDLSKVFDTTNHNLLLVKLEAYGLSLDSLRYICSYVNRRLQRTGENNSFSLWKDIIAGVPQGPILGPFPLNIYINELFLFNGAEFLGNYTDDITLYSIQNNTKSNQCLGSKSETNDFLLEGRTKTSLTLEHEVLAITTNNNLNFYSHLKQLCKKDENKLNSLTRTIPYLDKKQTNLLLNSYFKEKLSYCLLTFHSRRSNNLINKLQERALRVVSNDYDSCFIELLKKANENAIHINNIHTLMTESS